MTRQDRLTARIGTSCAIGTVMLVALPTASSADERIAFDPFEGRAPRICAVATLSDAFEIATSRAAAASPESPRAEPELNEGNFTKEDWARIDDYIDSLGWAPEDVGGQAPPSFFEQ